MMNTTKQHGGTFLGVILGLIIGLAIAIAVAMFITRTPTPFSSRDARTDRAADAIVAPMTDPNRSMYGKSDLPKDAPREATPLAVPGVDAGVAGLPPVTGSRADGAADANTRAAAAAAAAANSRNNPTDSATYYLQVGAFRDHSDADATRARLALLGFESDISERPGDDGSTLYRVRVGPYSQADAMNRARNQLSDSGVDSSVMRMPK